MAETIIDGKMHKYLTIDCNAFGDYGIFALNDYDSEDGNMIISMSLTEIIDLRNAINSFLVGLHENLTSAIPQ